MQISPSSDDRPIIFAPVSRRISAMLIDGVILFCVFTFSAFIVSKLGLPTYLRVSMVAVLVIGFEPFFVAFTGASIGHHYRGLLVKRKGTGRRLNLLRAFIRFFVKSLCGWYSLIFVFTTKKYQGLHDLAAGSVVVLKQTTLEKGVIGVIEQDIEETGYLYPGTLRRVLVMLPYLIGNFIVFTILFSVLLSDRCIFQNTCGYQDKFVNIVLSISWLIFCGIIVVYGWRGLLWGARRIEKTE